MQIARPALALCLALLTSAGAVPSVRAQPDAVTFVVDMRSPIADGWFDPKTETVGVRGGASPLTWARTLAATDPDGDGRYQVEVTFPTRPGCNGIVAYKFKVDGSENPNDGWENGPNRPVLLDGRTRSVSRTFDGAPIPFPETRTGDVRLHRDFPSAILPKRDVIVLLPPGYDREPKRRYPVLYMHDGQNVFDAATANGAEWCMDETAQALIARNEIEPLIVVGVYSIASERIDEYTPTRVAFERDGSTSEAGGKADLYGRMLVEEVKPFVDRTYRTKPGTQDTALGGSSLGGLVTLYLGLKYPKVFGKAIVASPSVWWDDAAIVKRVTSLEAKAPLHIWVDMGTNEGEGALEGARRLRDALVAKGWKAGIDLAYVEAPDAAHDESAWAARVAPMLRFLFPASPRRR